MFLRVVDRSASASETGRRGKRERQGSQTCCNPRDSLRQLLCDHCPTPFDSRGPVPSVPRLLSSVSPGEIRPSFITVKLMNRSAARDYAQDGETGQARNPGGQKRLLGDHSAGKPVSSGIGVASCGRLRYFEAMQVGQAQYPVCAKGDGAQ